MKTDLSVCAIWNAQHQAVEISHLQQGDKDLSVLTLDEAITTALVLAKTDDGHLLSGKGLTASLDDWMIQACQNLGAQVQIHKSYECWITFTVETKTAETRLVYSPMIKAWNVWYGAQIFEGFKTRLQAERFLARIWERSSGLVFIDLAGDERIANLRSRLDGSNVEHARDAYEILAENVITKPCDDMRWSITHEESAFYFDFAPLPTWAGQHYAVFCKTDDGDNFSDIVDAEQMPATIELLIDSIEGALLEEYPKCFEAISKELESIRQEMRQAFAGAKQS